VVVAGGGGFVTTIFGGAETMGAGFDVSLGVATTGLVGGEIEVSAIFGTFVATGIFAMSGTGTLGGFVATKGTVGAGLPTAAFVGESGGGGGFAASSFFDGLHAVKQINGKHTATNAKTARLRSSRAINMIAG
jgi:hypothetical protein